MSGEQKTKINVEIYGTNYRLMGETSVSYMKTVASHVNDNMHHIGNMMPRLDTLKIAVLAAVHMADEFFKLKVELERVQGERNNLVLEMESQLLLQEQHGALQELYNKHQADYEVYIEKHLNLVQEQNQRASEREAVIEELEQTHYAMITELGQKHEITIEELEQARAAIQLSLEQQKQQKQQTEQRENELAKRIQMLHTELERERETSKQALRQQAEQAEEQHKARERELAEQVQKQHAEFERERRSLLDEQANQHQALKSELFMKQQEKDELEQESRELREENIRIRDEFQHIRESEAVVQELAAEDVLEAYRKLQDEYGKLKKEYNEWIKLVMESDEPGS